MRPLRPGLQRQDRVQLEHRSPGLSDIADIHECSGSAHRCALFIWSPGRASPRCDISDVALILLVVGQVLVPLRLGAVVTDRA
jgi:hypothetical protein